MQILPNNILGYIHQILNILFFFKINKSKNVKQCKKHQIVIFFETDTRYFYKK